MSIIQFFISLFSSKKPSVKPSSSVNSEASIPSLLEQNVSDWNTLPPRSIYEIPTPKRATNVSVKDLGTQTFKADGSGLSFTISAISRTNNCTEPTATELEECFEQVVCFIAAEPKSANENTSKNVESPFLRLLESDPSFQQVFNSNYVQSGALIKPLRAKIRALVKEKSDIDLYLDALIKAVYLHDMAKEITLRGQYRNTEFNIVSSDRLITKKVVKALMDVPLDYATIGYKLFPSFGKTDIKWISKQYGEPEAHTRPSSLIRSIKRAAVIAHYQAERKNNPSHYVCKDQASDSLEWSLKLDVKMYLGYHKEWYERVKSRTVLEDQSKNYVEEALKVTSGQFIVADLETTGLDANKHHITEIGALLCDATGDEIARFEVVVNPGVFIPNESTQITGITNELVRTYGKSLVNAFQDFALFVGSRPIFFHNAKFDSGFLRVASEKTGINLENSIYDTLTLSRNTWKGLSSYSLAALCKELGIDPPKHRAMMDILATHKVLLKIREKHTPV
jgi:DNA polymerase III epsilon subunit family exonuclease